MKIERNRMKKRCIFGDNNFKYTSLIVTVTIIIIGITTTTATKIYRKKTNELMKRDTTLRKLTNQNEREKYTIEKFEEATNEWGRYEDIEVEKGKLFKCH